MPQPVMVRGSVEIRAAFEVSIPVEPSTLPRIIVTNIGTGEQMCMTVGSPAIAEETARLINQNPRACARIFY